MSSDHGAVAARSGLAGKLARFVATVGIATVLGPFIGGIVFAVVDALLQIFHVSGFEQGNLAQGPVTLDDIKGLLFVVMLGAYIIATPIAFIGGLIVAVVALKREVTLAIVLVAAAIANLLYFAVLKPLLPGIVGTGGSQFWVPCLVLSTFAGHVCWLLFRRVLRTRDQ